MKDFERQQPEEFEPATIAGKLVVYLSSPEREGPNGMRVFTEMITKQYNAVPQDMHGFIESSFPDSTTGSLKHRNLWGYYLIQEMVEFAEAVDRDIERFERESKQVASEIQTMDGDLATVMTSAELGNL